MKRFMFGSILRKLPLFIVLTVVLCSIAIFSSNSVDFVISHYIGAYSPNNNIGDSGILSLLIFFFIFMTFLPLFSMNYRYSLAKADVFKQAPSRKKTIRYAEHLSTLVIILIGFTFAYLLFVGLLAFRNAYARIPNYISSDYVYTIGTLYYVHFIPLYFATIFFGVAQYFISYFFVSRCNCARNSVIVLLMGELALMAFVSIIASLINTSYYSSGIYVYVCFAGASPALPIITLYQVFNFALTSNENYFSFLTGDTAPLVIFTLILSFVIFFAMAILGVIAFTNEQDPSGEFAGKSNTKKPYQEVIFHVGFALFGAFISAMVLRLNLLSYFLFLVLFLAAYYPLYGTLIRNFKLKPWQIGIIAGVVLFVIVIGAMDNWLYNYRDSH